jgi:hypothetical protein
LGVNKFDKGPADFWSQSKPSKDNKKNIIMLLRTNNNLPNGTVGWHYIWRSGADSVNDLAFRLYQDKTTA